MSYLKFVWLGPSLIGLLLTSHLAAASQEITIQGCTAAVAWKVLDAENLRRPGKAVFNSMGEMSRSCQILALRALGRIGSPTSVEVVSGFMSHSESTVRQQAAFALGLIPGEASARSLRRALAVESDSSVRGTIMLSLGRLGFEVDLAMLSIGLKAKSEVERQGAIFGFGFAFLKSTQTTVVPTDSLKELAKFAADENDKSAIAAAFALSRFKGPVDLLPLPLLASALKQTIFEDEAVFLIRSIGKLNGTAHRDEARSLLLGCANGLECKVGSVGIRVELVRALGTFKDDVLAWKYVWSLLNDQSSQVRFQVLDLVAKSPQSLVQDHIAELQKLANSQTSFAERRQALNALSALADDVALPQIRDLYEHMDSAEDLRLAVSATGQLKLAEEFLPSMFALLNHKDSSVVLDAIEAITKLSDTTMASFPGGIGGLQHELTRLICAGDMAQVSILADFVATKKWSGMAPVFAESYFTWKGEDMVEVKVSILNAIGEIGNIAQRALLEEALKDSAKVVVEAAAAAYQKITGVDVSSQIPAVSLVRAVTPQISVIQEALSSQAIVQTSKGDFVMAFDASAPLTAENFVKLAKAKFYDGKQFHRVVPHFVVQGGDPRGDGFGGPGYFIRDEVGSSSHQRGAVGIATAGKDTGGSQFFVNHGANLHLDGSYTVFAKVILGMDIVDQLEIGDKIKSVRLK